MARLLLLHDGVGIRSYPLERDTVTIGRHAASDIRLDDPAVSTHHAALRLESNPYLEGYRNVVLEDLGSTNGTLVNGAAVTRQVLHQGDRIRIGRYEFSFEAEEGHGLERTTIYIPDGET
ncbi:MAG: FHA domain-containing protein [Gammaproteobacteria bacterium HGW-Gammaproteobacteria-1]|jgi:pSer/pThr/pTyr-binding forkhead associated (FHA) protein|nr:MAG: FHA domain-containing protein [Gammaproteobacteria bacterium HGW-Gammaproteobacteria-1]